MSDETKFCRDCRWMRRRFAQPMVNARCAHPSVINLVTGEADAYCSSQRIYAANTAKEKCGQPGRLWEKA